MEATKIKMNMDGTIRAKVLQYKRDGNTLTEKWETLTKHGEGIYYTINTDKCGQKYFRIVFAKNGVYWYKANGPAYFFDPESYNYAEHMAELRTMYANYEADILQAAANGGWLNKLHITVMERLGHDVAPLRAAYEERKRKWEENERKRIEAAALQEQQRKEAEERRKAELLADGKEKLLANKAVTVEQIELLAEAVGYTIRGRTLGFMREKIIEAALLADGRARVWGRKLTRRNISGSADVLRKIAARIKAQAEVEAQHPAPPAEAPQISTETAEEVNISGKGEIHEISRLITFYGFGFSTAPDNGNLWRLYSNSKPITDYMTISQLLGWLRAYSHKQDTSNKPQPPKSAPQSPQTAQAGNYATPEAKARGIARKRQNSVFRHFRTTHTFFVTPRKCPSAKSPPIGSPR